MATRNRRCRICDRPIPAKRVASYPQAVLCDKDACAVENYKNYNRAKQKRWRDKKTAADPGFRLRALAACRRRYILRRVAAGKKVGPPASWAQRLPPAGTFLSAIQQRVVGTLRRLGMM